MKFFFKKPLFLALLINMIFLILCISIGYLRYGVKDDYFMAAILTGALGDAYNPHLYFVNALYGYVLIPFYHLFPKISWYYIGEMFGTFLSFTSISYILLKKLGFQWGVLFSATLTALLCSDFYLEVQFTQCAALFSATGGIAILFGLTEKKSNTLTLTTGSFLLIWGSVMRWEAFLMGLPFFLLSVILSIKFLIPIRKKALMVFIALLITIVGFHLFDRNLYNTPEYKSYSEFQGPRAIFGDGKYYDKKAVYNDLEKNGKSGENFLMLTNWKFYDTELFHTDSLKKMIKYVEKHRYPFKIKQIIHDLQIALSKSIQTPECWTFLLLGIFILTSNPSKKSYPCAAFFIILAMLSYLLYIHRLVPRVENGIWVYATIFSIPQIPKIKPLSTSISILILLSIYVGCTMSLEMDPTASSFVKDVNKKYRATYEKVAEYVQSNPNTIFFTNLVSYCAYNIRPPYEAVPKGDYKRIISYGYWTAYLPEIKNTLKEYNIENPLKDVVKENVIVIGDGDLIPFLQRNYYENINIELIHTIENVNFYKYSVNTK